MRIADASGPESPRPTGGADRAPRRPVRRKRTASGAVALAATLAGLAGALAAAPASAAVQTTTDPADPLLAGYAMATDVRAVTWDTTSKPGTVLLSFDLEAEPNARLGLQAELDTDEDGRADYAVDVANVNSVHPNVDGTGGRAVYIVRRVTHSTADCQLSYDNESGDYGDPYHPSPGGYAEATTTLSPLLSRTSFTVEIPLSAIGGATRFRWGVAAQSGMNNGGRYDFVTDATNGLPDRDPSEGTMSERDDWYCSADGLSYGVRMDLSRAPAFPSSPAPDPNVAPTVSAIEQTPDSPRPGQPVRLTAAASDPDGSVASYEWTFDADRADTTFSDATGATVTHAFPAGRHRVGVRVRDDDGAYAFAYRAVEVAARPSALALSASTSSPATKEKFTVTANVDSDETVPDSAIEWGLDVGTADNGGYDQRPGRSWTLSFGFPGTYKVKARYRTSSGELVQASVPIVVPNAAPVFRDFRIRAKKTPDQPFNTDPLVKGAPVILQAGATDDGPSMPRYEWDLDGNGGYDDAVGSQVEKTYATAGERRIGVRIVDDAGQVAFGATSIEIRESAVATCNGTAGGAGVRAVGCFRADPKEPDVKTSKEPIAMNGLELVPKDGAQVNVDKKGGVFTTGPGFVIVRAGSVVLFEGRFKMDADCRPKEQECLVGRFGAPALSNLKGFPIKGDVAVYLTPAGTITRVNVDVLGTAGLGITARADVLTTDTGGLVLNDLEVRSPMIPIGKLEIGQFYVKYSGRTRRWEGGGSVTLPTPQFTKLSGDFAFSETTGFERAHGEVDGLNLPLDLGTAFLQRIAFTIEVRGFDGSGTQRVRMGGGVGISAGPRVAGVDIATVDGDFLLTFGNPVGIDVEGRLSIAGYDIMGGTVTARTNGYVAADGFIGFGLPFPSAYKGKRTDATKLKVSRFQSTGADVFNPLTQLISVRGEASAWAEPDAFSAEASVYMKIGPINVAGAQGLLSSKGIAGCGRILGINGGFGYTYATERVDVFGASCDLGPYTPVRKRAPLDDNGAGRFNTTRAVGRTRQAGAATPGAIGIDVAAGQKATFLKLEGTGGNPVVSLISPDGTRYDMPTDRPGVQTERFIGFRDHLSTASYVAVREPQAGRWQIVPRPGSAPIATVEGAPVLPDPAVRATVRPSADGARQTIDYAIEAIPGQSVDFVEQGRDTHRTVGTATGTRGSLTFTPQPGAGRSRRLIAVVRQGGRDRAHLRVARFTAPGLKRMGTPSRIRSRRAPLGSVAVEWDDRRGVKRYEVITRVGDGRTLYRTTTCSRLIVPNVGPKERVRFEVRALGGPLDTKSAPARIRLKDRALRAPRVAPHIPCHRPDTPRRGRAG